MPRAIKIGLFKNGDPWFGPVNYHYLPGRDISRYISHLNFPAKKCSSKKKIFVNFSSFEALLTEITPKMDFINGVSYIFDSEGRRITGLDQIHDGGISTFIVKKKSNYFLVNF